MGALLGGGAAGVGGGGRFCSFPAFHTNSSAVGPRAMGTPSGCIRGCRLALGLQDRAAELAELCEAVPIAFRVLLLWDHSEACNVSSQVPSRVILACHLPGAEINLTAHALAQKVEEAQWYPSRPWPSWMVRRGSWLLFLHPLPFWAQASSILWLSLGDALDLGRARWESH